MDAWPDHYYKADQAPLAFSGSGGRAINTPRSQSTADINTTPLNAKNTAAFPFI
jgi:hypothetical protein